MMKTVEEFGMAAISGQYFGLKIVFRGNVYSKAQIIINTKCIKSMLFRHKMYSVQTRKKWQIFSLSLVCVAGPYKNTVTNKMHLHVFIEHLFHTKIFFFN